ncbi:MAG TPA: hypothetical protein VM260_21445 [Pirellula sp.]|nr:hypothetical protein [Pirellula sp.]
MKTTSGIVLIVIGAIIGAVVTSGLGVRAVEAQPPVQVQPSRYHVSAYAGPTRDIFGHGCYILDGATGELWHAQQGGKLEKVSDKIR